MNEDVVRRFQVRVPKAAEVAENLTALAAKLQVKIRIEPKQPADHDVLTVRLRGTPRATAAVRRSVPGGARITRDLVDLPPGGPPPGGLRHVYPDPRVLARIDPDETSISDPAPKGRAVVAIVDSGIAAEHPDLVNHLWRGPNGEHGVCVMDPPADPRDVSDQAGHGTMLAGSVLGAANKAPGIELMAVKIFDAAAEPAAVTAARGIREAVARRADIINISFDLGIGSRDLEAAVGEACAAGKLLVFAAGNTGSNNDVYPLAPSRYAALCPDNTLVVMASDWYDERPTFSNFGPRTVDLAAPGVRILTTRARWADGRRYGHYTGTSPAAAHVSGALALLMARFPGLKAKDLKSRLLGNAEDVQAMKVPRQKCHSGARLRLA